MSVMIFLKGDIRAALLELAGKFTEEEEIGDISLETAELNGMYVDDECEDIIDAINYITDEQDDI